MVCIQIRTDVLGPNVYLQRFVGPDLDPNYLQRLSANDKIATSKESYCNNWTWHRGYNLNFFMLNSAEHEIYPAHKVKMPTIVGILTFMRMINKKSERLKARNFFICR